MLLRLPIQRKSFKVMDIQMPIIAMTANAFSKYMQNSFNAEMNPHISKPIDMKKLRKTIKHIRFGGTDYSV